MSYELDGSSHSAILGPVGDRSTEPISINIGRHAADDLPEGALPTAWPSLTLYTENSADLETTDGLIGEVAETIGADPSELARFNSTELGIILSLHELIGDTETDLNRLAAAKAAELEVDKGARRLIEELPEELKRAIELLDNPFCTITRIRDIDDEALRRQEEFRAKHFESMQELDANVEPDLTSPYRSHRQARNALESVLADHSDTNITFPSGIPLDLTTPNVPEELLTVVVSRPSLQGRRLHAKSRSRSLGTRRSSLIQMQEVSEPESEVMPSAERKSLTSRFVAIKPSRLMLRGMWDFMISTPNHEPGQPDTNSVFSLEKVTEPTVTNGTDRPEALSDAAYRAADLVAEKITEHVMPGSKFGGL